jgi:hypothetical protein
MKAILAAAVAMSAIGFAASSPVHADVVVKTPGMAVESPYWRGHDDWRARREFSEHRYQEEKWLHGHCVRDWSGAEYCRR